MTDNSKPKTNAALISRLNSGLEYEVLETLEIVRETGNIHYIPVLIDLLLLSEFEPVRNSVLNLLNELKDIKSGSIIIEAIENEKYIPIRKELVSSCWQNGLDFSDYLPLFVSLVIDSEFETAFEAFTVIDSFEFMPAAGIRHKEVFRIDEALETATGLKKNLLLELRTILAAE